MRRLFQLSMSPFLVCFWSVSEVSLIYSQMLSRLVAERSAQIEAVRPCIACVLSSSFGQPPSRVGSYRPFVLRCYRRFLAGLLRGFSER
jgi:hypothetical protein